MPGQSSARRISGFIESCLPTAAKGAPVGPDWLHEIKHDGFGMLVCKAAGRVRLLMNDGADCARWYPAVSAAAKLLPVPSFAIDGELVCWRNHGIPELELLRNHSRNHLAFVYAFDLLGRAGEDLRPLPIEQRKPRLARLLKPLRGSGPARLPRPGAHGAREEECVRLAARRNVYRVGGVRLSLKASDALGSPASPQQSISGNFFFAPAAQGG